MGLRDLNALGGQARMTGPVVATSDEDDPSQPAADVHSGLIAAVADADPVATPSMIDAEQYLSFDNSMARAMASGFRFLPLTR